MKLKQKLYIPLFFVAIISMAHTIDLESFAKETIKKEIAADEFQLTSVISREKDVAAQSLAAIKQQGNDAHFKALIIAKGEVGNLTTALIQKFDGFGNLQTWVKNLDEVADAQLLAKLNDLDKGYFKAIDADLANTSFKNAVEKKSVFFEAWRILIDNPLIRKDEVSLAAISSIVNNPNLASAISKSDLADIVGKLAKKGVKCRTCASGNTSYKFLDEILNDIQYGLIKYGSAYDEVLRGFKQGGNFTEGAMYVAQCLRKYPDFFPEGTVFEFTEVTVGGVRRVDVRVSNTFYEFKSVATGGSPPTGFVNQFLKDLQLVDVTDLNQIKWWFDKDKISRLNKTEFLEVLSQATIDQGTINKLVKNGPKTKQALINHIDSNFNSIFLIK